MADEQDNGPMRRHERFRGEYPIVVEGLVNRFGDQVIHQDLDLKVKRGEILGVVGGSGTGKSVLMRSIIGLQPPAEGDIRVFDKSIVEVFAMSGRRAVTGRVYPSLAFADRVGVFARGAAGAVRAEAFEMGAAFARTEELSRAR